MSLKAELLKVPAAPKRITKAAAQKARILTIDIETSPIHAWAWSTFKTTISLPQIEEPSRVLCLAGKWYGTSKPIFLAEWQEGGHQKMIEDAYALINEADVVVHYNGTSFDMPNLHREFALAGYGPAKPYKNVDLLQVVRKQFRFTSNKLDFVAQQFGLGGKVQHAGFSLWTDVMAGDPKALRKMQTYNEGDVKLTEQLYDRVRPWIKNHPHTALYTGNPSSCPNCGATLEPEDFTEVLHTNVQSYAGLQCSRCGQWVRENKPLAQPSRTRAAL